MLSKIVFVHKFFPFGGAEKVTIDVANYLSAQGCDVTVITPKHYVERYPKNIDILFKVVEMPPCNIKMSKKARNFLYDYIVNHHIELLVSYRELLYMNWLKSHTGVRFAYVLHSMPGYESVDSSACFKWINDLFYKSKYKRVFNQCDAYGVLCPQYGDKVLEMIGRTEQREKICVLPNAIHDGNGNPDICTKKEKEILFVGRLSHRDKRVDRLLRIWSSVSASLPDWHLTIVGTGPEEAKLKTMAQELQLQRISFEGHQSFVQPYYDRATILCLTSSFEGWPITVGEAQTNGVIPVLFDSFAGAKDMVRNGEDGMLIPPFDEDAFAKALITIATSPSLQEQMQKAAISKSAQYSIEHTGKAWMQMLKQLTTHELR